MIGPQSVRPVPCRSDADGLVGRAGNHNLEAIADLKISCSGTGRIRKPHHRLLGGGRKRLPKLLELAYQLTIRQSFAAFAAEAVGLALVRRVTIVGPLLPAYIHLLGQVPHLC